MMTRRHALKTTLAAAAAPIAHSLSAQTAPPAPPAPAAGPFQLPPLPYPVDALEPHLDARTMEIHHGKHHAAYVANLNKAAATESAVGRQPIEALIRSLDRVPESVRTLVRNNGGGHLNHSLFWQMLAKGGGGPAPGELGQAITRDLGSFDAFREAFSKAALAQFGSGWAWLTLGTDRKLHVESTPNQDSPLTAGREPLLGLDVWEHAYYLKYQNRRADYIAAFFNVIRWDFVAARYQAALRA